MLVGYLGCLLFPDDELVLCMFESSSRAPANQAGLSRRRRISVQNRISTTPAVDEKRQRRKPVLS